MLTPDQAASLYFAALDQLSGILRAQRWSETVTVCSHCRGPLSLRTRRVLRGQREWVEACADCGRPWQPADLEVGLLHARRSVRSDGAERTVLRVLDAVPVVRRYAPIFQPRPRRYSQQQWQNRLDLWRFYLGPGNGCLATSARMLREAEKDRTWTADRVCDVLTALRAIISSRLQNHTLTTTTYTPRGGISSALH